MTGMVQLKIYFFLHTVLIVPIPKVLGQGLGYDFKVLPLVRGERGPP